MPFISLIVPVYNVEEYLRASMDSIISQTFDDFEIICVNDGSTDNSLAILEEYKQIESRVKIINQDNRGLSEARNTGIKNASGKYLCFMDSDDLLLSNAMAILADTIKDNEGIELISYEVDHLIYDDDMQKDLSKEHYYHTNCVYEEVMTGRKLFTELIRGRDFVESAWLLAVDVCWLKKNDIKFLKDAIFEDSWFALQCFFTAKKTIHINKGLYIYRVRPNSIMTQIKVFENTKWRLLQYENCLKYIFAYAENKEEIEALTNYTKQINDNLHNLYPNLTAEEKVKIAADNPVNEIVLYNMDESYQWDYNKFLRLEGIVLRAQMADTILIYGAGRVGKKVAQFLKRNQLFDKVIGFAVSEKLVNESSLFGKTINSFNSYIENKIDLIILATCKNHNEILENIGCFSTKNIILINMEIEGELDDFLLEEGIYE